MKIERIHYSYNFNNIKTFLMDSRVFWSSKKQKTHSCLRKNHSGRLANQKFLKTCLYKDLFENHRAGRTHINCSKLGVCDVSQNFVYEHTMVCRGRLVFCQIFSRGNCQISWQIRTTRTQNSLNIKFGPHNIDKILSQPFRKHQATFPRFVSFNRSSVPLPNKMKQKFRSISFLTNLCSNLCVTIV